ncbi:hypothetical protein AHF37_09450 [Paragonimus kellicotti]|nr:hypothetical protein AHF37_09450 [Paragonimus kellicotti]
MIYHKAAQQLCPYKCGVLHRFTLFQSKNPRNSHLVSLPASKSLCSPFTPELSKYDRNASSIGSPPLTSSSCHSPTRPTGSSKSSHRSKSSSSTISDRLPCQMAFAPASVGHLLDWLIIRSTEEAHLPTVIADQSVSPPVVDKCPLGPAISVYLMLRAIYRQCDRWDMIETRQAVKDAIERFRSAVSGRTPSADGEAKASEAGYIYIYTYIIRSTEVGKLRVVHIYPNVFSS